MERATGFEPATLSLEAASTKFRYRSPTFGIRATIGFFHPLEISSAFVAVGCSSPGKAS